MTEWGIAANMTQGSRAVGGRLEVSSGTVSFRPHAVDRATGGLTFSVSAAGVSSVGVAPRTMNPFDGGLRKRLRLMLCDGREVLFVVNRVEQVAQRLSRELAQG